MAAVTQPEPELDTRFSNDGAVATDWAQAKRQLKEAELYWLSTVRPDGRPHVTPLIAVWHEGSMYFCTGPTERKAKNLAENHYCALTTGCNRLNEGLDVVVEGEAIRVRDDAKLQRVAVAYESKYGSDWHFDVGDGVFLHDEGEALVFEVAAVKALAFGRGEYSQTKWRL